MQQPPRRPRAHSAADLVDSGGFPRTRQATRACLVVEDSPHMRQLLVFALHRIRGLMVAEASDAVSALRVLNERRFDLVVTDLRMPTIDGLKLIRSIRADHTHRDVPILVVTTESASEDRAKAMALGVNGYLVKPITAPAVVSTVSALLGLEV